MNVPVPTLPGMPAMQTPKQMAKTCPAMPAAIKRKRSTLIFKMPIEVMEEAGRYCVINPKA